MGCKYDKLLQKRNWDIKNMLYVSCGNTTLHHDVLTSLCQFFFGAPPMKAPYCSAMLPVLHHFYAEAPHMICRYFDGVLVIIFRCLLGFSLVFLRCYTNSPPEESLLKRNLDIRITFYFSGAIPTLIRQVSNKWLPVFLPCSADDTTDFFLPVHWHSANALPVLHIWSVGASMVPQWWSVNISWCLLLRSKENPPMLHWAHFGVLWRNYTTTNGVHEWRITSEEKWRHPNYIIRFWRWSDVIAPTIFLFYANFPRVLRSWYNRSFCCFAGSPPMLY